MAFKVDIRKVLVAENKQLRADIARLTRERDDYLEALDFYSCNAYEEKRGEIARAVIDKHKGGKG